MIREVYQPRKLFSLKEANETLPLVSRIVEDIVRTYGEIQQVQAKAKALEERCSSSQAEEMEAHIEGHGEQISGFMTELEAVGCEVKDFEQGLIDFPARLGNRIVLLCWKLGESEILHWHELQTGFGGRQPVSGVFSR